MISFPTTAQYGSLLGEESHTVYCLRAPKIRDLLLEEDD